MRPLVLLASLLTYAAAPASQTLSAGFGLGSWPGAEHVVAYGGTVTAPVVDGWVAGVHWNHSAEAVLGSGKQTVGALLGGRAGQSGVLGWTAIAGPSLTRSRRQVAANLDQAVYEPGVMARLGATVVPIQAVPVGLSIDLGLNVSTGSVSATLMPGLAVRFGG